MTAVSKNVYYDVLGDIVVNTIIRTITQLK